LLLGKCSILDDKRTVSKHYYSNKTQVQVKSINIVNKTSNMLLKLIIFVVERCALSESGPL
jgi:hypothetical protein